MGIKQLPSGTWRLQIRRSSLRVDETFPTEAKAREALAKYTHGKSRGKAEVTLDDAATMYFQSLAYLNKRERTRDTEFSRIKRILSELGSRPVAAITADSVEGYITQRLAEKPAPSSDSIRLEVAALSAVMNYCRKKSLIAANPCIGVQRPSAAVKPRRMHQEDEGALIALLSHGKARYRFAARLCLLVRETGARPGEWIKTEFNDIDFKKRTVTFRETKYKSMPRSVPLTAAAEQLLVAQLEDVLIKNVDAFGPTDIVFPAIGMDGEVRPMHYTGALRDIKKKGLLNKRVRAHTGRHEFISTLVESTDLDDSRIMSLVGHHSPASMEVYKHVRNIRFRPQIEEIEPARRSQRIRSLASVLNLPPRIIETLLIREREYQQVTEGKPDDGEELLFTTGFVEQAAELARQLGAAPENRLEGLARLRNLMIENGVVPQTGGVDSNTLTQAIESTSIGQRLAPAASPDGGLAAKPTAGKSPGRKTKSSKNGARKS